jgi:hypothetical protein
MLKEMAEPLVFVPTFVAGVESFLAGGAMVNRFKNRGNKKEEQNLL